jgi:hypothetical protein
MAITDKNFTEFELVRRRRIRQYARMLGRISVEIDGGLLEILDHGVITSQHQASVLKPDKHEVGQNQI